MARLKTTPEKNLAEASVPGRISVVMPCFNAGAYLDEAIESVLAQSYNDVELIVVDDGSTDGSREKLRAYGARIKLISQENRGPGPARNRGIREATGEFFAFLDADDYWHVECLSRLHEALSNPDVPLAYCGWQNFYTSGKARKPFIPPDYERLDKAEAFLKSASPWPIHAAVIRRQVLESVNGFDERWRTCMDYDLWLRIGVPNRIERVPRVLAFYRHHADTQITAVRWRQARNVWLVKRHFAKTYPELVKHIPPRKLKELIDGVLLQRGYDAFWKRDLVSAQKIFRMSLNSGHWEVKDLRYLLPALLPEPWFERLVASMDRRAV